MAIDVDLSGIHSVPQLLALLVEKLALDPRAGEGWISFSGALKHASDSDRMIRLKGLRDLEMRFPLAASTLLQTFERHNNDPNNDVFCLLVDDDYCAEVMFLQFAVERLLKDERRVERAIVNCWVKDGDPSAAERIARAEIETAGWTITSLEECPTLVPDRYPSGDPRADYHSQALVDGGVYVFYEWTEPASLLKMSAHQRCGEA